MNRKKKAEITNRVREEIIGIINEKKSFRSKLGWFVRKPRVTMLLVALIIFWGIMSAIQIPKESAPEVDFGIVNISTLYTGASAYDIDSLVTQELEKKLKDIEGLNKINSTSRNSFSSVTIEFDPGQDMTKAIADIRSKIDEAKPNLPSEAEDPTITEITSSNQTIFNLILTAEHLTLVELRDYAEDLKKYLETISKVNEVIVSGGEDREIVIDIDPLKLEQFDITLNELITIIRSSNNDIPIGEISIDDLEYNIRYEGKFKSAEDIGSLPIKSITAGNGVIFLNQVASVEERGKESDSFSKFYSQGMETPQNAVIIQVFTKKRAGIFSSDEVIRKATNDYVMQNFPTDIKVNYTRESITEIAKSYNEVFSSAAQTVLIVFLTILFFLGFKEALITAAIIPLTFLATFGVLRYIDTTLNFMTNFSMILAIGILVDTAIVIVEGVYANVEKGYDSVSSAEMSISEFFAPLVSGTLTTLAVFIPLISLPGILGQYLSFIPITVSIILVISLLIALTANPTLASLLLRGKATTLHNNSFVRKKIKGFLLNVEDSYQKLLCLLIQTRTVRMGLFFLILICFVLSFLIPVKFELFPSDDSSYLTMSIKKPIGTIKEKTLEAILPIEKLLINQPEIEFYEVQVNGNTANINIELYDKEDREKLNQRSSSEMSDYLFNFSRQFTDMEVSLKALQGGPPSEFPVGFRVIAESKTDIQNAQKAVEDIKKMLIETKGTQGITDDIENVPGDFILKLNKELAITEGINPTEIPGLIRTALKGSKIASIDRNDREIDINIRFQNGSESDSELALISDIANIKVINKFGAKIPIGKFADIDLKPGLNLVKRLNTNITFTASSQLLTGYTSQEVTAEMLTKIEKYEVPEGVIIQNASENEENQELFMALLQAFIVAIIVIFTILVTQFGSLVQPLLILATIIFSQTGVNIGLFLTNTPRSLAFIIGVISLAGIVVNDAIIMVDQMNKKMAEAHLSDDKLTICKAARSRLQPVILTTLTTTAGILPLVFIDAFWAGLGYTVVFGLSVASLLTLFVTPGMYYQVTKDLKFTVISIIGFLAICGALIGLLVYLL
jgi:multidrug efflux pump subunit AcrB